MINKLSALSIVALAALGIAVLPAGAHAFGWMMNDFGATPFDHNDNWSPIDYGPGYGHLPSPGPGGDGGEKFDIVRAADWVGAMTLRGLHTRSDS